MWTWLLALSAQGACERIGIADILAVPPPAVLVLGVRSGTEPDLYRASRVVWRLRQRASVRLAIDSVRPERQSVLDAYADLDIEPEDLAAELDWANAWGFPYQPYARLLAQARHGVELLGVGHDDTRPTPLEDVPVPAGYEDVLRGAMAGHAVPDAMIDDFVRYVAWRDEEVASRALAGWDRRGYVVIVADRAEVEGGRGISWQAAQLVEAPVWAFSMAWAGSTCFEGDAVWRPGPLESTTAAEVAAAPAP
jgi:hypothetical protein